MREICSVYFFEINSNNNHHKTKKINTTNKKSVEIPTLLTFVKYIIYSDYCR